MPEPQLRDPDTEDSFGGTWWTHRSPGIRSDSDLHTFGYSFKPWVGPPIATAEEILSYMGEVIDENDIAQFIRYRHQVTTAAWSSGEKTWSVSASHLATGVTADFTCNFLWMCQGYYRHNEGYTPDWDGMASSGRHHRASSGPMLGPRRPASRTTCR